MKKILLAIPFALLLACGVKQNAPVEINYLNQKSPGKAAALFAPGIVSTDSFEHSAPVFSPDGRVVLWNIVSRTNPDYMLEAVYNDGEWSAPHRPSFGDKNADDYYPSFSTDGKTLYFASRRENPAGYKGNNMRLWMVERNDTTWGNPLPIDSLVSKGKEYAHSITADGKLYFSSQDFGPTSWDIHASQSQNGKYTGITTLPFGINSVNYEDGPFIAADESYLIFEAQRAEGIDASIDLYIAFRLEDGRWSLPVNMGPTVNTAKTERLARVSPDNKYLFFGSNRETSPTRWGFDLYWIDAGIIDELKVDPRAKMAIEQPLGDDLITALTEDNTEKSVQLLKEWTAKYPEDIEGARVYIKTLRKQKDFSTAGQFIDNAPNEWMNSVPFLMEAAFTKFGLGKNEDAEAMLAPLLVDAPETELKYWLIINGVQDMGLYDVADNYFDKGIAVSTNPANIYNRACFYAKLGEKDRAFRYLDSAADKGFNQLSQYDNDGDLASLKSDSRWIKLRKKLK
jgi:tetratricopeptide (TPR) repeat protein